MIVGNDGISEGINEGANEGIKRGSSSEEERLPSKQKVEISKFSYRS